MRLRIVLHLNKNRVGLENHAIENKEWGFTLSRVGIENRVDRTGEI